MNLFDELCKDAKADLDSGVFLQGDPVKGDNAKLNDLVDQVEKKMNDALQNAVDKITQASQPGDSANVPGDGQPTENNTNNNANNESEGTNNGND